MRPKLALGLHDIALLFITDHAVLQKATDGNKLGRCFSLRGQVEKAQSSQTAL